MSTWKPGSRGRPPSWAIEKGIVSRKADTKSPLKTMKTIKKGSPIKKNTWHPGSRGRVPAWYKEENPDWKTDLQPTVIERQLKDALNKKQCNWTPGKPGRPPAWAVGYLQKEKAEKDKKVHSDKKVKNKKQKKDKKAHGVKECEQKTKWQQPGDRGRPPLWAQDTTGSETLLSTRYVISLPVMLLGL